MKSWGSRDSFKLGEPWGRPSRSSEIIKPGFCGDFFSESGNTLGGTGRRRCLWAVEHEEGRRGGSEGAQPPREPAQKVPEWWAEGVPASGQKCHESLKPSAAPKERIPTSPAPGSARSQCGQEGTSLGKKGMRRGGGAKRGGLRFYTQVLPLSWGISPATNDLGGGTLGGSRCSP